MPVGSTSWRSAVRLKRNTDHLELEVGDNGQGIPEYRLRRFNASVGTAGVGITGMRERVRELGGHLEIRSVKNGTKISVDLPATNPSASPKPTALSLPHESSLQAVCGADTPVRR